MRGKTRNLLAPVGHTDAFGSTPRPSRSAESFEPLGLPVSMVYSAGRPAAKDGGMSKLGSLA